MEKAIHPKIRFQRLKFKFKFFKLIQSEFNNKLWVLNVPIVNKSVLNLIAKNVIELSKYYSKFASSLYLLAHGVTGNTSGFGPEESRFEP